MNFCKSLFLIFCYALMLTSCTFGKSFIESLQVSGGIDSPSLPPPLPQLSYSSTNYKIFVNETVGSVVPAVVGSPSHFDISPALPSGLTLNTATGEITGSSNVITSETTYTVTLTDINGQMASAQFTMATNP